MRLIQTSDWLKHFFNSLSELLHANSSDLPEIFLLFHFGVNLKFKITDLASDWLRHYSAKIKKAINFTEKPGRYV
jgi:hypothetical protein